MAVRELESAREVEKLSSGLFEVDKCIIVSILNGISTLNDHYLHYLGMIPK